MYYVKKISRLAFIFLTLAILVIITLGYIFTFYKENMATYKIPETIQSVQTKYGNITYLEYGNNTDQPILMLHGTGANAFIYEKTSIFLSEHGYYVIATDLPPFGFTSIESNANYTKEEQANKILSVIQYLKLKNPIILGHSYNSKVALQIASKNDASKLVLVAPVLDYSTTTQSTYSINMFNILVSITPLRDSIISLFINNEILADKILLSFMHNKDINIENITKYLTLPFNKKGANHAYSLWFKEFFLPTSTTSDIYTLNNYKGKVYVLWGNKDTISSIDNFENIKRINDKAKLFTLDDVGHMPHLEDNTSFNKVLLEALESN